MLESRLAIMLVFFGPKHIYDLKLKGDADERKTTWRKNMKKLKFDLPIQFFAEDAEDNTDIENDTVEESSEETEVKTFTQEEVNKIVGREVAKVKRSVKKETQPVSNPDETEETNNQKSSAEPTYFNEYASSQIQLALVKGGVSSDKVERISRLVDMNAIVIDGSIDVEKLDEEVSAIITEYPELISKKEITGLKIGADTDKASSITEDDEINKAFGIKKK